MHSATTKFFLPCCQHANANVPFSAHATHLANLVPLNASTHRPHAPVIHGFLDRAGLPEEIIAFSACVLDALSARFAAAWRDALAPSEYARGLQNFLRSDSKPQQVHVSPDIIVLAALSLAHVFLVDRWRSSRHWSLRESDGAFSVQEIEATQRAILQDLDYGLFRISNEAVQRQLGYMRCPVPVATAMKGVSVMKVHRSRNLSMSLAGTAKWCHGVQTPEPSP